MSGGDLELTEEQKEFVLKRANMYTNNGNSLIELSDEMKIGLNDRARRMIVPTPEELTQIRKRINNPPVFGRSNFTSLKSHYGLTIEISWR